METYELAGQKYVRGEPIPFGVDKPFGAVHFYNEKVWDKMLSKEHDPACCYAIPVPASPPGYEIATFAVPKVEDDDWLDRAGKHIGPSEIKTLIPDSAMGRRRFILRKIEAQQERKCPGCGEEYGQCVEDRNLRCPWAICMVNQNAPATWSELCKKADAHWREHIEWKVGMWVYFEIGSRSRLFVFTGELNKYPGDPDNFLRASVETGGGAYAEPNCRPAWPSEIPQAPKALKLVLNREYRTRGGWKARVIKEASNGDCKVDHGRDIPCADRGMAWHYADGRYNCQDSCMDANIIAEWEEPERAGGEVITKPDSPKCTPPVSGPSFLDPEPKLSPVDWFRKYGFQRQASLEGFPPAFELGQTAEYRPVQTCACCHGKLQATRTLFDKDGQMVRCLMPCPECGGTGWHTERSAK